MPPIPLPTRILRNKSHSVALYPTRRIAHLVRHFTTSFPAKMAPASSALCVIAGVGPGTGASVARKFAKHYPVVLLARNTANLDPLVAEIEKNGGKAVGISTDVTSAKSMESAFAQIKALGDLSGHEVKVAAAVFNVAGGFSRKPFLETTLQEWEAGHETNSRGAFLFAQHTLPLLLATLSTSPPHPPTLIFTGATASVKGSALFGAFASGKFAQRALSQSLSREFGPKGIHVAHAVIDGVIDIERTKAYNVGGGAPDAKIDPAAIADAYWHLHTQPRTSFTWEIDIRPYVEKW